MTSAAGPVFVVNADDFGISPGTNRAVVESFSRGWVSSTTMIANGRAFEEACALARDGGFGASVGLHLNLVDGEPLSEAIRKEPRFCSADGRLVFSSRDVRPLSGSEKNAVAAEIRAQWQACVANGIDPSHLDSHRHSHLTWGVLSVVLRIAAEAGIRAVRIASNVEPHSSAAKTAYFGLVNARLRRAGLSATRFLAHSHQAEKAVARGRSPLEIVVHASLTGDGEIRDRGDGPLMADRFRSFALPVTPVNVRSLRAAPRRRRGRAPEA